MLWSDLLKFRGQVSILGNPPCIAQQHNGSFSYPFGKRGLREILYMGFRK